MVTELRTGVWWIDGTGVNAYLVEFDGQLTLIDTGTPLDADTVMVAVREIGYELGDVDRILVTHYDPDHVGALGRLATDAPIYIGREDAEYLLGTRRPDWGSLKGLLQCVSTPFVSPVDAGRVRCVDDGDTVGRFEAFHTPGHTPGHVVYVHERRSVAFLGDLVIERSGSLKPAPSILSYERQELRESIRRFADTTPAFEAAAMGHGTPFKRGGDARLVELDATIE